MRNYWITGMALLACTVLAVSCKKNMADGFDKNPNGLLYKFIEGTPLKQCPYTNEDVWIFNLTYSTDKDSVFAQSEATIPVFTLPDYKGDVVEGFRMMQIGDSAHFLINADTFFLSKPDRNGAVLPNWLTSNSKIQIAAKLKRIESGKNLREEIISKAQQVETEVLLDCASKYQLIDSLGIYQIEKKESNGTTPQLGDTVEVAYTITLGSNGVLVYNTADFNAFMKFAVGDPTVLPVLNELVIRMKTNEIRKVIAPSMYTYGSNKKQLSNGNVIPPCSPLVMDVRLVSVKKGNNKKTS